MELGCFVACLSNNGIQLKRAFPRELAKTLVAACLSQPSVFKGIQNAAVFKGVQNASVRFSKAAGNSQTSPQACPRQPLSQLQAPAMCFLRRSRLPFGRPQTFQTPPQAYMPQPCVSRGVQGCKPVQGNHFRNYRPQPCVFYGVRDCRLAARKRLKAAVCPLSNF